MVVCILSVSARRRSIVLFWDLRRPVVCLCTSVCVRIRTIDRACVPTTQLTIESKKVVRVPGRQPFSGMKREPVPYGISLIFASSSVAIISSMALKLT